MCRSSSSMWDPQKTKQNSRVQSGPGGRGEVERWRGVARWATGGAGALRSTSRLLAGTVLVLRSVLGTGRACRYYLSKKCKFGPAGSTCPRARGRHGARLYCALRNPSAHLPTLRMSPLRSSTTVPFLQ